jgi:hypothetical protein
MWDFHLTVAKPPLHPTADADRTFYWHKYGTTNYFASNVGPLLGSFGNVNERNIDLVRIASGVLSADRSAPRTGSLSRWNSREITLTVDVLAVAPWEAVANDLERLLGFLTGDHWHLRFEERAGDAEQIAIVGVDADRVVLLSGGADSATGALLSALELGAVGKKQVLLSHWAHTMLSPLQSGLVTEIERLAPGTTSEHIKVHHSRGGHSPGGSAYKQENSTRSRSLLFIALGLAASSVPEVPLWIPENGYASINPPLSKSRRGSLSTKTTHPKFFEDLRTILESVGAHNDLINPYTDLTKGEMFTKVKAAIGEEQASAFLSATNSCSHTGARRYGVSPRTSCGVCFGCVLRRASFQAADLPDGTAYLQANSPEQQVWLDGKSVITAMHDFLASPFSEADLAHLQIPASLQLSDVANLCTRGRDELRGLGL